MTRDLCGCGRPRATDDDLERWRDTVTDRPIVPYPAALPASELWASALCWTIADGATRCGMRRRWASDVHIAEAREVFAAYVADLEDFLAGEGAAAWALS